MSQERLVFPIVLSGYGTIEGMSGYQSFVTWLKHRNESYDNLLKYLNEIEAYLGAPDNPEDEWSAFEAIQKLKGEDCEHNDMVDAAIAANEWKGEA